LADAGSEDLICLRHQASAYRDMLLNWLPARRRFVHHGPFGDRRVIPIPGEVPAGSYPTERTPAIPLELEAHRITTAAVTGRRVSDEVLIPTLTAQNAASADSPRIIVIAPFASAVTRDLSTALVVELATALRQVGEFEFVLTGSAAQAPRLRTLAEACTKAGARSTVDLSPPAGLIELLGRSSLVISAESAPAHLATALDRPLVALLGGGHFGLLAPWQRSSRQRWLSHDLPCYGCDWNCVHAELLCLTKIEASHVIRTAQALLRETT
jgi:ADP-heptose:LPS heptosyltransferase